MEAPSCAPDSAAFRFGGERPDARVEGDLSEERAPEADGQSEVVDDPRGGGELGHFGIPFQSLCPRFPVLRLGEPFYASDVPSQRRLGLGVSTGFAKARPVGWVLRASKARSPARRTVEWG